MKLFARIFLLTMLFVGLFDELIHNGEPRKPSNRNFTERLVYVLLWVLLLYIGGFFA